MAVDPVLAQWLPVIIMLMAIWFGLLYNNRRIDDINKRIDDLKDALRAEIEASRELFQAEIRASEERIMRAMEQMRTEIRADIRNLDLRIEKLEAPLLRPT